MDLIIPKQITFFCDAIETDPTIPQMKENSFITTGQRVSISHGNNYTMVSPVTGTIQEISSFTGILGKSFVAVNIETAEKEEFDSTFKTLAKEPSLLLVKQYMENMPGTPSLKRLLQNPGTFHTLIVNGVDRDLMLQTQRYFVKNKVTELREGISWLKRLTGIENIILALRENDLEPPIDIDIPLVLIKDQYPAGLPHMVARTVTGKKVLPGREEDVGVCVFTAEAVANIGESFIKKQIPSRKILTIVNKELKRQLVSVKTGIHIKDIFTSFSFELHEMDRVFVGGPMTGVPVFSENHPICPWVDGLFVQNSENIATINDYPCTNCGDCVRICPVHLPVNMLAMLLKTREYHIAAEKYGLFSCVGCGLCSYICMSHIPITQYIEMAKKDIGYIKKR